MSKIDFEKARRRRLPKDVCTDAPWHNEDASVVARLDPRADGTLLEQDRAARKKKSTVFVPRLTEMAARLETMAADVSDFYYRHCLPERKLVLLIQTQKRIARIAEREGGYQFNARVQARRLGLQARSGSIASLDEARAEVNRQ